MSAKSRYRLCFCWVGGLWAALLLAPLGCGYRALNAAPTEAPLAVAAGQLLVPDTVAAQAALSGARAELASVGRLASSSGYPRFVLDILRIDEASRGIHVQTGQPAAAGMSLAVVVRGRILPGPEQDSVLDTGDVRRAVQITGDADPRVDSAAYDQAIRSAAERAGRAAARIALGIPEPSDELP